MAYKVDKEKCIGCGICVADCPGGAELGDDGKSKIIDQEKCSKCGTCLEICPPEYNAVVKLSPVSLLPSSNLSGKGAGK